MNIVVKIHFFFILLFGISIHGHSQADTLVLSSGEVKVVELTKQEPNGNIEYTFKGESIKAKSADYITFKKDGLWYRFDDESKSFRLEESTPFNIKRNFFNRDYPSETIPKWRFQVNLVSPLINADIKNAGDATDYWRSPYSILLHTNRVVSIDVGYMLHDKLVLNFPLRFGLNSNKTTSVDSYGSTYNSFIDYNLPSNVDYSINEISIYQYNNNYYNGRRNRGHDKHLVMEAGISPKFYPFGQVKNAFYIAQTLSVGVMDYKAIDYYTDLDTSIHAGNSGYPDYMQQLFLNWNKTNERFNQRTNQFTYLRYEALVGLDFNINYNWAINIEVGLSTAPKNRGNELDQMYIKTPGYDYQLVATEVFQATGNKPYAIGRFQLIFKF